MPDHWAFVVAAYTVTALALAFYWHRLGRRERELTAQRHHRDLRAASAARPGARVVRDHDSV